MKETEFQKRMLREIRQLLADLEAGNMPANPAVEAAVREQVLAQMKLDNAPVARPDRKYLAFINTTKQALAATPHGLPITNVAGEIVALVIPDSEGYTHHHAEEVRDQVEASIAGLDLSLAPVAVFDWARLASAHGAKLNLAYNGLWQALDQPDTVLWAAWFESEQQAAFAYCKLHGIGTQHTVASQPAKQRRTRPSLPAPL